MKDYARFIALMLTGLLAAGSAARGDTGEVFAPNRTSLTIISEEATVGTGSPGAAGLRRLRQRALAGVCASCHGTDGRSAAGALIPTLAGMPGAYMREQFQDFLDGNRPATVMPQILKGLTPEQMDDLATYFARIPRLPGATP